MKRIIKMNANVLRRIKRGIICSLISMVFVFIFFSSCSNSAEKRENEYVLKFRIDSVVHNKSYKPDLVGWAILVEDDSMYKEQIPILAHPQFDSLTYELKGKYPPSFYIDSVMNIELYSYCTGDMMILSVENEKLSKTGEVDTISIGKSFLQNYY